jgi:hypothetical protein
MKIEALDSSEMLVTVDQETQHNIPEESSWYLFLIWCFDIIMPRTCRHKINYACMRFEVLNSGDMVTRLQADWFGVQIPQEQVNFFLFWNI